MPDSEYRPAPARIGLGRFLRRLLTRALGLCIVLLLGCAVYLDRYGAPPWLLTKALERVNAAGPFVLEAKGLKLRAWRGIELESVRLYRKTVVGPSAIDAAEMRLLVDPARLLEGWSCLRDVRIRGGSCGRSFSGRQGRKRRSPKRRRTTGLSARTCN